MVDEVGAREGIELPKPSGGRRDTLPKSVDPFAGDYWMEKKLDGVRMTVEFRHGDDNLIVGRGRRNGRKGKDNAGQFIEYTDKIPSIAKLEIPKSLSGTVVDGELVYGDGLGDVMSIIGSNPGRAKKIQAENGPPEFWSFDCLFLAGDDIRDEPIEGRKNKLFEIARRVKGEGADWFEPIGTEESYEDRFQEICEDGYEGVVFKKKEGGYGEKWYKLKRQETADGYVIDVTQGKSGGSPMNGIDPKPDGTASTFTVAMEDDDGETVEVAKVANLPDYVQEKAWQNFEDYKGRVIEFSAARWDKDRFTFARFQRWRPDKSPNDCVLDEQKRSFE